MVYRINRFCSDMQLLNDRSIMKGLLLFLVSIITIKVYSKDYFVQDFGVRGDHITLNTRSIQIAIDYVSEHGGGRLIFGPGNYVTGSVYIKANVTLHLEAGCTIWGSTNPYDYIMDSTVKWKALIFAIKQDNIGITGSGTIDGR